MKKLKNPTTYFFEQAEHIQNPYAKQIQEFVSKLIDRNQCQLCKESYDTFDKVPRILIHCGHTFCTVCLKQFYTNRRVRCPMCLKLVKHLDSIQRLPINHTIFQNVVKKNIEECKKQKRIPEIRDAKKFLFSEFERIQREAHLKENPQKYDPDSGLLFCVFHPDRVEHFFCQSHKTFGCRVCIQIGHSKSDCKVVDLYTVDDPEKYQNLMEKRIQQPNVSDPFIPFKKQKILNLNNDEEDEELVGNLIDYDQEDDDDSVEKNRSAKAIHISRLIYDIYLKN